MNKIEKYHKLTSLLLFVGTVITCILILVGLYLGAVIVYVGVHVLIRHIRAVVTESVYQEVVDEWNELCSKNNLHF